MIDEQGIIVRVPREKILAVERGNTTCKAGLSLEIMCFVFGINLCPREFTFTRSVAVFNICSSISAKSVPVHT